jgi:hypothetical protein
MKNKQINELIFRMQVWTYMDACIETTWIAKQNMKISELT